MRLLYSRRYRKTRRTIALLLLAALLIFLAWQAGSKAHVRAQEERVRHAEGFTIEAVGDGIVGVSIDQEQIAMEIVSAAPEPVNMTPIPEPATYGIMATIGLTVLIISRRLKQHKNK